MPETTTQGDLTAVKLYIISGIGIDPSFYSYRIDRVVSYSNRAANPQINNS